MAVEQSDPIVTTEMMKAWGYPNDDETQQLIAEAAGAQRSGEITCIADAKQWARRKRPRPT